jgi:ribonuclease HI
LNDTGLPHVLIYTDGGCNPNPGPGGWGAVILRDNQPNEELCGGDPQTTNNRMELTAALSALDALKEAHRIDLYTDSQYVRRGVVEWVPTWSRNGWRTSTKRDVANRDLWMPLARQLDRHEITWHWTRGHAGNQWNERADELASAEIARPGLPLDDRDAIHAFAGAAYSGKTKRGAWAVVLRYQSHLRSLSGHEGKTSANRMHIRSAIEALRAIKRPLPVHLYTTSDYLKNGATLWHRKWASSGWKTASGKAVSNRELWQELLAAQGKLRIEWHVVNKDDIPDELKQAKHLAGDTARRE